MFPEQPREKQFSSPILFRDIILTIYWGFMRIVVQRLLEARAWNDATLPSTKEGGHTPLSLLQAQLQPKRLLWSPLLEHLLKVWVSPEPPVLGLFVCNSSLATVDMLILLDLSAPTWNSSTHKRTVCLSAMKKYKLFSSNPSRFLND